MELNTVISEIKGNVGIITLNRLKALNAVSEELLRSEERRVGKECL